MKLLFFSPYFYPYTSGITTYPLALFSELVNDNHITVLTFPHEKNLASKEYVKSIEINRLPYLFKVSKGFISPQSIYCFWKETKKNDVVVVNIPNFEGLMLAIFAKLQRKPLISIFHCKVHLDHSIKNRILSMFLNISVGIQLSLSNKITVYTRDYAKNVGIWKKYGPKIIEILPPVPCPTVDEIYNNKLKVNKAGKTWIGYAGRFSHEKGLENLVQAISILRNSNKMKAEFEIVFAGPYGAEVAGELHYYNKILELLNLHNVPFQFLGTLKGGKLGAFYRSIDVLVLPSTNSTEAFGMVQTEAMMSGTPVVVSDLPGVRVPVQYTGMGIIVQHGDPRKIADALEMILSDRFTYTSSKMKAFAQSIFSIKNTVLLYRSLLNSLKSHNNSAQTQSTE